MMRHRNASVVSLFCTTCYAIVLTIGLTSCTKETSTQEFLIDGHRFVVPREYLLPSQVAWFPTPKPSGNGFGFTINPTLPLPEQFAVGLESRKITCRPDKLKPGSMLADACSGDHEIQRFKDVSELRKEFTYPDNDAFWHYTVQGPGTSRIIIAYCHAVMSSRENDSCSVFGWYKSLVYSFSIKDKNIANLDQRRAQIESLLSSWERR